MRNLEIQNWFDDFAKTKPGENHLKSEIWARITISETLKSANIRTTGGKRILVFFDQTYSSLGEIETKLSSANRDFGAIEHFLIFAY